MDKGQLLLELTVKAFMILAAAGLLTVLLRKTSAALRHTVWSLALGGLLLLPLLTVIVPAWRVAILPAPDCAPNCAEAPLRAAAVATEGELLLMPINPPAVAPQNSTETFVAPAKTWSFNGVQLALMIWAAGVVFVLARLAFGTLRMRRITRDADCLTDYHWSAMTSRLRGQLDLPSHISLYASAEIAMPVTWGVLRPVVVLPAESADWSSEWRRIVLLHELAHIKRRDCLTQMIANLACALYWCNPLVWVAARQLRNTREQACDDEVLAVGTRASEYASCLVDVAKSIAAAKYAAPVAVGMACSQLTERVTTILNPAVNRRKLTRRVVMLITMLVACLIVPLASLQPYSQAAGIALVSQIQAPQHQSEARSELEKQQREVEKHLREIEKHRREITEVHQREIERHLRALEKLQGTVLTDEMKAQLEAELKRAVADSKVAEQELEARLRQSNAVQDKLHKRQSEIEAMQKQANDRVHLEMQAELERELRSLHEKDDGRFIKVATISGHCMQYHPHGEAAISDQFLCI